MSYIGSLKHKIEFLQQSTTIDEIGGRIDEWSVFKKVSANVSMASEAQRYYSEKLGVSYTHKIVIRELSGINENMRVRFDGIDYKILSIVEDQNRLRFQILKVKKVK